MPRRREVPKREILPDPKYHSTEVAKFVNVLMTRGKKSVAERIIYGAMDQIQKKTGKDPVEVRSIRRNALAMRWLRDAARKRAEKSMGARLAGELAEAAEGRGGAVKKREEVHRMAEANKAFAHYRF